MTRSSDFERDGYAVWRRGIDATEIGRLERELVQTYPGPLCRQNLRMARHSEIDPAASVERSGIINSHLWRLPTLRAFSDAMLRLLTSNPIYDALNTIGGETRYTLHQSIFFFVSPRLSTHLDNTTLDTIPPARSFTVWIAIDDVLASNGPTYVIPMPRGQYQVDTSLPRDDQTAMLDAWERAAPPTSILLTMRAGDFAVWAPTTPHGSLAPWPINSPRRSIQAIYRPTSILKWGNHQSRLADFHDVGSEEEEVNSWFNCLISKRAETNEHFRRAGFEAPAE